MTGLKTEVIECIQQHRRKKTKKLEDVERDMQAIINKRGTTVDVLVKTIVSIPVHIGKWVGFRNKAVRGCPSSEFGLTCHAPRFS